MIQAQDVISIYRSLAANQIQIWLLGGWGVDALLREQTRPHKDLDVFVLLDDVGKVRELLSREGYCLHYLWPENRWSVDSQGAERPTAFILQDSDGREVDVHAMRLDDQGTGVPAWANERGFVFRREDLAGVGIIAGVAVRCFSAEMQMLCHTGYDLPDAQRRDVDGLHDRFGVELPAELSHSRQPDA